MDKKEYLKSEIQSLILREQMIFKHKDSSFILNK